MSKTNTIPRTIIGWGLNLILKRYVKKRLVKSMTTKLTTVENNQIVDKIVELKHGIHTVKLVPCSIIGDSEYYDKLKKESNEFGVTLYSGITDFGNNFKIDDMYESFHKMLAHGIGKEYFKDDNNWELQVGNNILADVDINELDSDTIECLKVFDKYIGTILASENFEEVIDVPKMRTIAKHATEIISLMDMQLNPKRTKLIVELTRSIVEDPAYNVFRQYIGKGLHASGQNKDTDAFALYTQSIQTVFNRVANTPKTAPMTIVIKCIPSVVCSVSTMLQEDGYTVDSVNDIVRVADVDGTIRNGIEFTLEKRRKLKSANKTNKVLAS